MVPFLMVSALSVTVTAGARAYDSNWQIGTPIATYWSGPALKDAMALQYKAGGFNLVWCEEKELATAQKHGLRTMLQSSLLTPETLDDPAKTALLDDQIERVKKSPAMYAYFLRDEPSASDFPGLGKLVAHLRAKDPAHLAYINLFPTYANNQQLGVAGDLTTAYKGYLDQFISIVKPSLLSYDHYSFQSKGDGDQYFLNLAMIRQAAIDAGIPFLNIVQACSFDPSRRKPNADELRFLSTTSLAYGAQGLSYFVYYYGPYQTKFGDKAGMMMTMPGAKTTVLYDAAKQQLPEFVAFATQLAPLKSIGAYHVGKIPVGGQALPPSSAFTVADALGKPHDFAIGLFGTGGSTTATFVANLDYNNTVAAVVTGPGPVDVFDATTGKWSEASSGSVTATLPPGGGMLVRVHPQ
ncbi:MAG: hypothetical protein P4L46_00140 [Fimbriimonas sp.]|nr:hypothetical protein [Fimbriimonas sp.]